MFRFAKIAIPALLFCLPAAAASAGVYADDMGKCLVKSLSAEDQTAFIQWIFVAMAAHPSVQPYANVTSDQRNALNKKTAQLVQRLETVDCRAETVAALKYEGAPALQSSFSLLGETAMTGLLRDPNVAQGLSSMDGYFDKDKMQQLFKDAGVPYGDGASAK